MTNAAHLDVVEEAGWAFLAHWKWIGLRGPTTNVR